MYRKVIVFLLTILVVIIIAGCLKPSHQKNVKAIVSQTPAETEHIPDAPSTETAAPGNPASGDELFAISKLNGAVSAFTEDGCTVAPTHEEGDVAGQIVKPSATQICG